MSKNIGKNRRGVRLAKNELKRQLDPKDYGSLRSGIRDGLVPGLRERLLSIIRTVQEVRATDYDDDLCVDFLAAVTGTRHPSARRWIDKEKPGLPDLTSFATLCRAVGIDAAWLLGLTPVRLPGVPTESEWLRGLVADIDRAAKGLIGMRVEDRGMEPDIQRGDWVLVDTNDTAWHSGGRYVLALAASEAGDLDSRMPSLLFVDGDAATLWALSAVFETGYKVATTGETNEALGLLARQHFDVIVCDQRIPQVLRQELMQVAKKSVRGGTVCLLMTDPADTQMIVDALNDPFADRVVVKPWEDDKLRQVVDEAILLARKLTRRRSTDEETIGESMLDETQAAQLPGRLGPQSAVFDSLATDEFAQPMDPTQYVIVLRDIVARAQGGFAVSANTPQAAFFSDAAQARALGIHTLGRVKSRISITPA